MNWFALIPIGLNLLTQITHKENTMTAAQSGVAKKQAVMEAVGQTVQTVIQNAAPNADANAAMSHISTITDGVVGLLNVFGIFKKSAAA